MSKETPMDDAPQSENPEANNLESHLSHSSKGAEGFVHLTADQIDILRHLERWLNTQESHSHG